MPTLSQFEMQSAKHWTGITSRNHIGNIYRNAPQKASSLMTRIYQQNFGQDLDSYLEMFGSKQLETNDDFEWDLIGTAKRNVPLVEAQINGNTVSAGDKPGLNHTEFELVFPEYHFTDVNLIVGEKNEDYPLRILDEPTPYGNYWKYRVQLMLGDPSAFVPVDELAEGKRFSKEWSPVEPTLSQKGGGISFTSPLKMRNAFTQIRLEHTTPGDMINYPMGTAFRGQDGKLYKTWTQYEDFEFERQFREERNRALMFSRSNRDEHGNYHQAGKSGNMLKQGSGIREQMEAANTTYYNHFDIDFLANVLIDLSEGKLRKDTREFVLLTGERGALKFHQALQDKAQTFQPLQNTSRIYSKKGQGSMSYTKMGLGYGGQFIEFQGPNGIKVNLQIEQLYDDRERNKIYHPDGGVAESHRFDILDVGTMDGEPNIQKVHPRGQWDILGYEPGLRNPFSPNGKYSAMSNPVDGYKIHRSSIFGTMVKDPSRTASLIPNILS